MKKQLWNGIMRAIRHGFSPVIAFLTAEGYITGEQGATLVNSVITMASVAFAILWSVALAKVPLLGFLGR